MADLADITEERNEKYAEMARKQREAYRPSISTNCIECNIHIPIARQEATGGTDMCVDCQELAETRM